MGRKDRLRSKNKVAGVSLERRIGELREAGRRAVVDGNLAAAEKAYAQAVALGAKDADISNNLAAIYSKWSVKLDEQIDLLGRAYELKPENPEIRGNFLATLSRQSGALMKDERYRDALPLLQRKVQIEPGAASNHREVGYCLAKTGDLQSAVKELTRAVNLDPNNPVYYNDLGLAYFELRWLSEAQGAFQEVLRLCPRSIVAYTHLGLLANLTGLTGLGISFLRRALEIDPNCSEVHNNLALLLRDQGEQALCRQHYEQAVRLRPENGNVFSGYLLALNDDPNAEPEWVAGEHRRFQGLIKGGRRSLRVADRDRMRRLRVGYLSPDFRMHSVAFFICPVLEQHDRKLLEVTCYSTGFREDDMSARIKAAAECYRNVYRMSDDDLAELIQADGIDVLVELSGHTCDNRLVMLGNRVAPIQVTYLGYPNTTGLTDMDYRLTDAIADPVGNADVRHTEKLVRIEGGFLAYQPPEFARQLPVADSPWNEVDHISYGSFNNLAKINDVVLDTWAAILERVPGSTFLLKARGLRNDKVKERILAAFAARGVAEEGRIQFMGHEREAEDHFRLYHRMDVALDTFPYNGTTTTCEALWMGTPVLTLEGSSHAGRVGASLLTHAGLPELVAKDRQTYVDGAVALGKDRATVAKLRSGLRERFAGSAVMDASRLARALEGAYREAWNAYCDSAR